MAQSKYGELIPLGGGDPIPLLKKNLLVGRRESCDVVLRFANVSAHHCQLTVNGGYWYVRDLKSLNGVKVNDVAIVEKRLSPGDRLTIAKHRFEIDYVPQDLGAVGPPPPDEPVENLFSQSLLERAGLDRASFEPRGRRRHDPTDDSPGKLRRKNED